MKHKHPEHVFREPMQNMDCAQAEVAVLKHMEQTISTQDAQRLAQHVKHCQSCKEYYLAFDEIMEYASAETDWQEAPEGFTATVMASVGEIHVKQTQPEISAEINNRVNYVLHVLWGMGAILLGVAFFFVYNPEHFANLVEMSPNLASISAAVSGMWASISQWIDRVMQSQGLPTETNLGIMALLFVLVLGSLLVVLHRDQERKEQGASS